MTDAEETATKRDLPEDADANTDGKSLEHVLTLTLTLLLKLYAFEEHH
jgi:hypothetical protein